MSSLRRSCVVTHGDEGNVLMLLAAATPEETTDIGRRCNPQTARSTTSQPRQGWHGERERLINEVFWEDDAVGRCLLGKLRDQGVHWSPGRARINESIQIEIDGYIAS